MAYSQLCHQEPERSFRIAGAPMAVCARCCGIYIAAFAVVAVYPLLARTSLADKLTPSKFALFLLPLGMEWTLEAFGIIGNWKTLRFTTGFVAGCAGALFVVSAWMSIAHLFRHPRNQIG